MPSPKGVASSGDPELAKERALIQMARTALLQGDSASALAALDKHVRDFPRGRLAEERDYLRVEALSNAGRAEDARAESARFRENHPDSLLVPAAPSAKPDGH
jgi:TolA-binding protein